MVFSVSPSVTVTEVDLTSNIPSTTSTTGAIAGVFNWGPIDAPVLITSESELVSTFGKPSDNNGETFFVAADFLSYSNQLYVSRTVENAATAASNTISNHKFDAKYPGALGNAINVSFVSGVTKYAENLFDIGEMSTVTVNIFNRNRITFTAPRDYSADLIVKDNIKIGNDSVGYQTLNLTGVSVAPTGNTGTFTYILAMDSKILISETAIENVKLSREWAYAYAFGIAPDAGSIHFVVTDSTGDVTGIPGQILEKYTNLSIAQTALDDGTNNYYRTVINTSSNWINVHDAGDEIIVDDLRYTILANGADGFTENSISFGKLVSGYDDYTNKEQYNIDFILQGKSNSGTNLANYIIGNICETRKDCVLFISPGKPSIISGTQPISNTTQIVNNIIAYRNALQSSSYWFMDTGYKYRYDKYNDVYRWIPLNGDMAGLAARVDPWVSPAGYKRGLIKNVVKLAFNPNQIQRDILYPNDINSVISQNGQGTLLFGDKTGLGRSSAFDRINVRRLFIAVEKAIARASASILFDFNDEFTQTEFKNIVDPYLRDIKGKRGITDYIIVCDSRVNTPDIVDKNTFRANIFLKPSRSINFLELTFIATRTGVSFEEIVGQQF